MNAAALPSRRDPLFCDHCERLSDTVFVLVTRRGKACWPCLRAYVRDLEDERRILIEALGSAVFLKPKTIENVARRALWGKIRDTLVLARER
jgi:hypothetical protein